MNRQKLEYLIERLKEDKHSKRTETIQIVLQELQELHKFQFGCYYHFREKAFYDSVRTIHGPTPQDVNSPAEVFPISKQASEYQKRKIPYNEVLLPEREQITPEQFELNFREAL